VVRCRGTALAVGERAARIRLPVPKRGPDIEVPTPKSTIPRQAAVRGLPISGCPHRTIGARAGHRVREGPYGRSRTKTPRGIAMAGQGRGERRCATSREVARVTGLEPAT